MTLQLQLLPELEKRLLQDAVDERRAAATTLLQRWTEEDAALTPEEAKANAAVLRQPDERRPSHRKLFTD